MRLRPVGDAVNETLKHAVDGVSVGTVIATLAGWLPELSAFLSIVWVAIRIWETETLKKLTGRQ
jgi:hypothetical protein